MPSTARGWRSSLTALIAEFLLLAIPLNIVYGFAMSGVYRLGAVAGLGFASLGAIVAICCYLLFARYLVKRSPDELETARLGGLPRLTWLRARFGGHSAHTSRGTLPRPACSVSPIRATRGTACCVRTSPGRNGSPEACSASRPRRSR